MSKKEKKIFKKKLNIAPKVTFTNRWTNWRISESKSRKFNNNNILNNLVLKSLWQDKSFVEKSVEALDFQLKLQHLASGINKKSSITRQKNYCSFVGRSRSVNKTLFIARHTLRKFIRFGLMPGFIQEKC